MRSDGKYRSASSAAALVVAGAATLGAVTLSACVAPGPQETPSPCTPAPRFFVDDMWLGYFDANGCTMSSCHDFTTGHGYLRFHPPGNPPQGAVVADWTPEWRENYYSAVQLLDCGAPLQSRLLTVPEGKADPHEPGPVIDFPDQAEALFTQWFNAH